MDRLKGKAIIVAGAGGIGNELARRYASEGGSVIVGDIDGDTARGVTEEITEAGGTAIGIELDGSDDDAVKASVDRAKAEFGRLDGFHANFACFLDGETEVDVIGLPLDIYDEVMRVNARGFLLCTRHAVPAMIESGGGSIIYTSSGSATIGEAVRVAYAMSKVSTHALMRHVARRFGPNNIRANVIAPGVIAHPRFNEVIPEDMKRDFMQGNMFKDRLGEPADIAAMGALLLSDDGKFITGQVMSVDGGDSMRP